jgi:general secretion pathway protein F
MVNEGSTFHRALSKYPKIFNPTYIAMCEAGEMSGTLDMILIRLAEFTEASNELQTKVKGALIYPVLMLVVTLGLLVFIFTYIIPKIVTVFDAFPDLTLPWITRVIISTSELLLSEWYLFVGGILGFFFLFRSWKNTPQGKTKWDQIQLQLPIFGEMNRMVAVSRFTRTLATLLTGGVPMLNALQIVKNVVDNNVIAKAIEEARSNISEGESIAGPLKKSNQFPPIVIHMVSVGEKTGELENMLIQVSNAFEFQLKAKIDSMTSLMGPVVLILMGLAIAVIVFAIMLPMFELQNLGG